MSDSDEQPVHGRISIGLEPGTLARRTIEFVRNQLPAWRDDPERELVEAEEALNGQLCKFLNFAARSEFPMAQFHHEERQAERRRVDLSAVSDILVGHTKYQPFLVMEGKRLPSPSSDREREYVIGTKKTSGGIERFKLGLHGDKLTRAAMIGYVQGDSFGAWHTSINTWIDELTAEPSSVWRHDDCLTDLDMDRRNRVAVCRSAHSRVNAISPEIELDHLWIEMTANLSG
ncbi:MAG: hypothetical protein HQ518_12895 [Rhodopirellula sp.]|nr:hypothetical protein [Rhodopirellula sp.]